MNYTLPIIVMLCNMYLSSATSLFISIFNLFGQLELLSLH